MIIKPISAVLLASCLLWAALPVPTARATPAVGIALAASELTALQKGDVVVRLVDTGRTTMKDVWSIGYVEAPVSEVWRVITDYDDYPRIFPNILKSETRKRVGPMVHNYSLLDYPWPFEDRWTLNEIVHDEAGHRTNFHRIDGTVKEIVGGWRLYPEGRRTLVVYTVRVDPGLPFVPTAVIEWGTTQVAPGLILGVRKFVKR